MPIKRAGRVYEHERELAIRQANDTQYAVLIGRAAALNVSRHALAGVVRDFQRGGDIRRSIEIGLAGLRELLVQAMTYSRLRGLERSQKVAADQTGKIAASRGLSLAFAPAYTRGLKFLRQRQELSEADLAKMEEQADQHVVRVLAKTTEAAQSKLMETVSEIHRKGLHNRAAISELRDAWSSLGLTERNSFQIEATFRTQSQLAYAAGQAQYEKDPDIQSVLWGYKYVTVGDNRVRPTHVPLDGTTLPKDDPFWQKNRPPNGWACRCQVIPLYRERAVVEPPKKAVIDGKEIEPGADKGFQFNPGSLMPPPSKPKAQPAMPKPPAPKPAPPIVVPEPKPEPKPAPAPAAPSVGTYSTLNNAKWIAQGNANETGKTHYVAETGKNKFTVYATNPGGGAVAVPPEVKAPPAPDTEPPATVTIKGPKAPTATAKPETIPPKPAPVKEPKPKAAPKPKASAPVKYGTLKDLGQQVGSNPGGWHETADGQKVYVKKYATPEQVDSDIVANRLYRAAGIETPDVMTIEGPVGEKWIGAKQVAGLKAADISAAGTDEVRSSALTHVLMGNRDWNHSGNYLELNGKPAVVDNGGTFTFRAMGSKKQYTEDVLTDLEGFKQYDSTGLFSNWSPSTWKAAHARLKKISDAKVDKATKGTALENLAATIKARRDKLLEYAEAQAKAAKAIAKPKKVKLKKYHSPEEIQAEAKSLRDRKFTITQAQVDRLNEDAAGIFNRMTSQETDSLIEYTGGGYRSMNERLREAKGDISKIGTGNTRKMVDDVQRSINQASLPESVTVVRGVDENWAKANGIRIEDLDNVAGTVVTEHGFMSTSIRGDWKWGRITFVLDAPAGSKAMYVEKKSSHKHEKELLFGYGKRIQFTGSTKSEIGGETRWILRGNILGD
jgi:SPP1 gp7 family putative phage head morphogenesis protein